MRLRVDSMHIAGWKRAHDLNGCQCVPGQNHVAHDPEFAHIEPAQEGDVWRLAGFMNRPETAGGYALTCPKRDCAEGVHRWWHAAGCPAGNDSDAACVHGADRTSCWTWTGTPEEGNLSANPSLWCMAERGGCGWHGWLRDGSMVPA